MRPPWLWPCPFLYTHAPHPPTSAPDVSWWAGVYFTLRDYFHPFFLSATQQVFEPLLVPDRGERAHQGKPGLCSSRIYNLVGDRPMVTSKSGESWDGKEQSAKSGAGRRVL